MKKSGPKFPEKPVVSSFSGENAFLSNFYFVPIKHEGISYPSVEHAFQAAKTFDRDKRKYIATLPTPSMAKRAGRQLILRKNWNQIRLRVMRTLLQKKFQHPQLTEKLLATGNAVLIEGNHWGDTFWGICNGEGENHLGTLLMEIRDELRNG